MLKNYLIVALRHLRRNKVFSLVNLLGLSLGLATFLVIFIFVSYHKGFDRYHDGADRIVRMGMKTRLGGELIVSPTIGAPGAEAFSREIPEIEAVTRVFGRPHYRFNLIRGGKELASQQGMYADPSFFDVFSIPMIAGDPSTALAGQKSIVLTEEMVANYFGPEATAASVVGELLELKDKGTVQVTGVCADVPAQTHFDFDILLSQDMNERTREPYWMGEGFYTYIKLREGATVARLTDKFAPFTEKYIAPEIRQFLGTSFEEFQASGGSFEFTTMPLREIHLGSHTDRELAANANGTYINVFLGIGVLILLLAVINFINLSAASNIQRLKEVGVRKVMGAQRSALALQFMTEAVLITLVAFVLGLTLQQFASPLIGQYFGVEMGYETVSGQWYATVLLAGSVLIGIGAGAYPAILLSATRTTAALKGQASARTTKSGLRHVLLVIQFSITIGLLSCVAVITAQVNYLQTKPLGFDKDQVMLITNTDQLGEAKAAFRQELQQLPGVEAASITSYVPTGPSDFDRNAMQDPSAPSPETFRVSHVYVDEHFLETLKVRLLAGRNFSAAFGNEEGNVIINRAMAVSFGWSPEEALDKTVEDVDFHRKFRVIGVTDDFHAFNMSDLITPFFFKYATNGFMTAIRFDATAGAGVQQQVRELWSTFSQQQAHLAYLDELFMARFEEEKKVSSLFQVFTVLAAILSGMGLFAITAFVTHQRMKEIGIRKVLGAEAGHLFYILNRGMLLMLLIAAAAGLPVMAYGMEQWLQTYPYRIGIPLWALLAPVAGIAAFALLVSGWHVVQVIRINPVETLKDE